ncbi:SRPBCC family protein [Haloechinothrix sp. YIM 98757]|uniref:SRPBCC family protein n=1 Tax=Haloechinothrix aidingensis TaxID=2752311 RepID=A0A838A7E3_9PSEU|nr:SRPBCC family protein [Haloechinothrix aidingensis]MBA0124437.1 SRPBCC family protein [Haloechinothrix aidingensis]
MTTLRTQTTIDRPAQEVWDVVSDAGNISAWFPAIATSSASGDSRHCELADGTPIEEEIVTNDPQLRRFQYRITGGLPVESHLGTVDVLEDGEEALVLYSTEITPDSLAETLGPAIEEGLTGLKRYCEQ